MIVEIVAAAETELDDAIAYYNAQRPGLGSEFAATVQRIVDYPNAWQKLAAGARRCQLQRFDYGLIYWVHGDVATIYAVMHLKRRPGYWRKRLKRGP